jgi:hypothetical protein
MTDTTPESTATETAKKRAAASNFLPIVRGRLPLVFVHAIRFDEVLSVMGNKDLASKFGTSVGKIFDIKKGRNFGYVGADYKPTADDLAAAKTWISQVGAQNAKGLTASGDPSLMSNTLKAYESRGLATPQELAAMKATKAANKPPKGEKAPKAPKGETVQPASGASLLS